MFATTELHLIQQQVFHPPNCLLAEISEQSYQQKILLVTPTKDTALKERDKVSKEKMKQCADKKNHAEDPQFNVEDNVLV